MEVLVSVIIPVYNVEKYLSECIDSVLNQEYSNIEVILIDDGSTDTSPSICDDYCNMDKRVKCIHKKNGGLGSARNTGIRNATGYYIYFLDSDDFIDADLLSKVIPYMENEKLDLCFFSAKVKKENGLKWNKDAYIRKNKYLVTSGENLFIAMNKNHDYSPSNCLCITRTSLIKKHKLMVRENQYYEDNYFLFQLMMHAQQAGVLNEPFYNRRVRAGSIMTSILNYEKKIDSAIKVIEDFNNYKSKNEEVNLILKKIIYNFCLQNIQLASQSKSEVMKSKVKYYLNQNRYFKNLKIRYITYICLNLGINYKLLHKLKHLCPR